MQHETNHIESLFISYVAIYTRCNIYSVVRALPGPACVIQELMYWNAYAYTKIQYLESSIVCLHNNCGKQFRNRILT